MNKNEMQKTHRKLNFKIAMKNLFSSAGVVSLNYLLRITN